MIRILALRLVGALPGLHVESLLAKDLGQIGSMAQSLQVQAVSALIDLNLLLRIVHPQAACARLSVILGSVLQIRVQGAGVEVDVDIAPVHAPVGLLAAVGCV